MAEKDILSQLEGVLLGRSAGRGPGAFGRLLSYFGDRPAGGAASLSIEAHGVWGSLGRVIAALLARRLGRCVLFLTAHVPQADQALDDLETLLGAGVTAEGPVAVLFPAAETHDAAPDPTSDVAAERLRILLRLSQAESAPTVLVAPVAAVMQGVPSRAALERERLELEAGEGVSAGGARGKARGGGGPEGLVEWLVDHDFERVEQVERIGQFSQRGGIVDIYPPAITAAWEAAAARKSEIRSTKSETNSNVQNTNDRNAEGGNGGGWPVRVEFFGDEVESLRFFDLDTQRSVSALSSVSIASCAPVAVSESVSLLEYLPADTVVVVEEGAELVESGRLFRDRLAEPGHVMAVEDILRGINGLDTVYANRFGGGHAGVSVGFDAQSVQRWENQGAPGLEELAGYARGREVWFFCENPAQQELVRELLGGGEGQGAGAGKNSGFPPKTGELHRKSGEKHRKKRAKVTLSDNFGTGGEGRLRLPVGMLHQGFALPGYGLICVSHHEVFGQEHVHRRIRPLRSVQAIESFTDLEAGDLVVHVNHGIGRFRGLQTLTRDGRREEFLTIEYAGKAMVHVPADKIFLVHKYVGSRGGRVPLARLGSRTWQKQKERVADAVEDLAGELLEIQAQRQASEGIAYPPDTRWQVEFEESFAYPDTEDQVSASREIKGDMEQASPMDRLLCGDVGYGKTELAVRAAFKAVESGKQVAVLVPTTVLAEQHYRTFTGRLADFPFMVEVLSRFKTAGQARGVVERLERGRVDVLIGTHRILSPDVRFRDLGLVIIDEEQRFGVEHKERLKRMRATVDVLTMTATPIPRTLHMALLGLRNISSLSTPPLDRRAIVTEVQAYDQQRIRQAILAELGRDGQVYFLHNRVGSIHSVAEKLRELVPEARFVVGHGQMSRRELESTMLTFLRGEADVLVCTTIIESGLDIPSANTIIISDADRFGLAELHQLRGRVGRYKNRAYAHLLLPTRRTINPTAVKRLKAIEEYSQLGSGFRIALRDLEIRGAGNILGAEQSGHIDSVGYELYCQMLGRAVRRLREEPEPVSREAHLELGFDTHIPGGYISSARQRMEVYRRLTACTAGGELEQLERDLADQFGPVPRSVGHLLQLAEVRLLAAGWTVRSIVRKGPDLIFVGEDNGRLGPLLAGAPGRVSRPDEEHWYLRLPGAYLDTPDTLLMFLRKLMQSKNGK